MNSPSAITDKNKTFSKSKHTHFKIIINIITENQCDKLFHVPIHIITMLLSDIMYASYNGP